MPDSTTARVGLTSIDGAGSVASIRRSERIGRGGDGRRPPVLLLSSSSYLASPTPGAGGGIVRGDPPLGLRTGASRLISGHLDPHAGVEAQLAAFKGTGAALLFPSGYQANVGTIGALVGRGDHVFSDALNHASIIDGCRLSRASSTSILTAAAGTRSHPGCDPWRAAA